jgi:hypothetical protein
MNRRRSTARSRGQALGCTVTLATAVVVAACSGGSSAASNPVHDSAQEPAASTARVVRISGGMSPHAQARVIANALNAGQTVTDVRVAIGSELRWKIPPSSVNIYPNTHVVQPLVFGHHLVRIHSS